MNTKAGHIEIFVKNPLKSKDFYLNVLGFSLVEIQAEKFVWLKKDSMLVLLRPGKGMKPAGTYQQTNIAFVIYSDSLMETKAEFESNGVVFKGDDGENCFTFCDLDGNWFQLVDPNH